MHLRIVLWCTFIRAVCWIEIPNPTCKTNIKQMKTCPNTSKLKKSTKNQRPCVPKFARKYMFCLLSWIEVGLCSNSTNFNICFMFSTRIKPPFPLLCYFLFHCMNWKQIEVSAVMKKCKSLLGATYLLSSLKITSNLLAASEISKEFRLSNSAFLQSSRVLREFPLAKFSRGSFHANIPLPRTSSYFASRFKKYI